MSVYFCALRLLSQVGWELYFPHPLPFPTDRFSTGGGASSPQADCGARVVDQGRHEDLQETRCVFWEGGLGCVWEGGVPVSLMEELDQELVFRQLTNFWGSPQKAFFGGCVSVTPPGNRGSAGGCLVLGYPSPKRFPEPSLRGGSFHAGKHYTVLFWKGVFLNVREEGIECVVGLGTNKGVFRGRWGVRRATGLSDGNGGTFITLSPSNMSSHWICFFPMQFVALFFWQFCVSPLSMVYIPLLCACRECL